ncbi:helix-turn-helix domain-containing protein [Streptomyces sp. NPDC051976]|uniref:helix-turn-helix domain-containing protein n=1 Tax=Streptomyces sp. NPDC051976 TaxID=3154947 RepID=UPI0034279AA7
MRGESADGDRWTRWAHAVAEIGRVGSGDDADHVLDLIAERTTQLSGYDCCVVLQLDPESRSLHCVAASGVDRREIGVLEPVGRRSPADVDGGLPAGTTLRAFREGRTVEIPEAGLAADPDAVPEQVPTVGAESPASIAVPLMADGSPTGVLCCYGRGPVSVDGSRASVLEAIAGQASSAIVTARLRSTVRSTLVQLEEKEQDLTRRQAMLEKSERLHHQLMRTVLAGHGLDDIVAGMANALQAPLALVDTEGYVLARADHSGMSAQPLPDARRAPVSAVVANQHFRRRVTGVRADGDEAGPDGEFWLCPVLVEGEPTAWLWVRAPLAALGPIEAQAVERGAMAMAMALLKRRTALEVELRLARDVLTALVTDEGEHQPDDLLELSRNLGHDLSRPNQLIVAALTGLGPVPCGSDVAGQRIISAALRTVDGIAPKPLVGLAQGLGVIVLPVESSSPRSPSAVAEAWRSALEHQSPAAVAHVVVTEPCDRPPEFSPAFTLARSTLRLAALASSRGGVVDLGEFGLYSVLLRCSDPAPLLQFASRRLAAVREYDERRGTDLMRTLRAYLKHGGRTSEVGADLMVHGNTVLNRVTRLEELLGADLASPQTGLEMQLALMVSDVSAAMSPERPSTTS